MCPHAKVSCTPEEEKQEKKNRKYTRFTDRRSRRLNLSSLCHSINTKTWLMTTSISIYLSIYHTLLAEAEEFANWTSLDGYDIPYTAWPAVGHGWWPVILVTGCSDLEVLDPATEEVMWLITLHLCPYWARWVLMEAQILSIGWSCQAQITLLENKCPNLPYLKVVRRRWLWVNYPEMTISETIYTLSKQTINIESNY